MGGLVGNGLVGKWVGGWENRWLRKWVAEEMGG